MAQEIRMPLLSDSMIEAQIITWYKKIGDQVKVEDVIADVETEKATLELNSYVTGTVLYLACEAGEFVKVNDVLVIIGEPHEDLSSFEGLKFDARENLGQDKELFPYDFFNKSHTEIIIPAKFIFFSYSSIDFNFVSKLANDIRILGGNIWIDRLDIRPGQLWDEEIQKALSKADCILVVLSRASIKSDNVLNEIHFALIYGKRIIPIIVDECEIPLRLIRLHYIDFKKQYNHSLEYLLHNLGFKKP